MKYGKGLLLLTLSLTLVTGCKKVEKRLETDISHDVFAKVSSQVLKMRDSTFQLTEANKFKFHYDADVILLDSLRAHCVFDLAGTASFVRAPDQLAARARYKAHLVLDDIQLVRSVPNESNDIDSGRICLEYSRLLEVNRKSDHLVYEFTGNSLSFAKLQFQVRTLNGESNIGSSELHDDERDYSIDIHDFESCYPGDCYRDYFIADGETLDLTEIVLTDIGGKYAMTQNGEPDIAMTVDAPNHALMFASQQCGFTYSMKIVGASISTDNRLTYNLEAVSSITPPSLQMAGDDCERWNKSLQDLPNKKAYFGYRLTTFSPIRWIFMPFPAAEPGYIAIESFQSVQ